MLEQDRTARTDIYLSTRQRLKPMLARHRMSLPMGFERMTWLVEELAARAQAGDYYARILLAEAEFDYTMIEVP